MDEFRGIEQIKEERHEFYNFMVIGSDFHAKEREGAGRDEFFSSSGETRLQRSKGSWGSAGVGDLTVTCDSCGVPIRGDAKVDLTQAGLACQSCFKRDGE